METIESKQNYIGGIIGLIHSKSEFAGEIFADQPDAVKQHIRFELVKEFNSTHESGYVSADDLSAEMLQIARCWCCRLPLNQCLMLEEEGHTWVGWEADPYMIDRAQQAGFARYDEKRRMLYIPLCGYKYND